MPLYGYHRASNAVKIRKKIILTQRRKDAKGNSSSGQTVPIVFSIEHLERSEPLERLEQFKGLNDLNVLNIFIG